MHALTFSQLDGRNSCRAPKGLAGSQGHLQGGPASLTCLQLSAQLSFVSLLTCLHGSWDAAPVRPSFFSAVALEGKEEKRGCSKHNAFRMCYLLQLRKGGEELAPPFLCIDPRWCRSSCGMWGDGAARRPAPAPWSHHDLHLGGLLPDTNQRLPKGSTAACLTKKKKKKSHRFFWCFYLIIFGTAELIRFFLIHLYIHNEVIWITVQPPYYLCVRRAIYY